MAPTTRGQALLWKQWAPETITQLYQMTDSESEVPTAGVENTLPEVDENALPEADENTPPEGLLSRPPLRELFPPHHDPIHHQASSPILPFLHFSPPQQAPQQAPQQGQSQAQPAQAQDLRREIQRRRRRDKKEKQRRATEGPRAPEGRRERGERTANFPNQEGATHIHHHYHRRRHNFRARNQYFYYSP